MNDDDLLVEAMADAEAVRRLLAARPDLAERFCALVAEERLLPHALATGDDAIFTRQVMATLTMDRRPEPRRIALRRRTWLPWSLAAAACLVCAVLAAIRFQPSPPAIAWVDGLDGMVRIAGEPAQAGAGLPPGRILSVAEGGTAALRLGDGTRLAIGGGGRLSLDAGPHGVQVELLRGRIHATVAPQAVDRRFLVRGAHALVQVVGTAFSLLEASDGAHLEVQEGRVQVERPVDRAVVLVSAGQSLDVAEGRPFTPRSEPPPPVTARLLGFTVCDAATGKALPGCAPLLDGAILDLGPLPGRPINIRADAEAQVDEVLFTCEGPGPRHRHSEQIAPYFLYGNRDDAIQPWSPAAGTYRLTAVPRDRDGRAGAPLTMTFTIRR